MNPPPKLISKTRLMRGYRCLKSIYLNIHKPKLEAPITPDQQALFNQGNIVGEKARERFHGGILVDNKPWDFVGSLKKTRELISSGAQVLYEAAFEYNGCYARADIIQLSPDTKRWKIFEVKSSTKIKNEHLDDVGLQAWIVAKSGFPIEQINILHINPECTFPNLDNLFTAVDVTSQLRDLYPDILPKVTKIFSAIKGSKTPDVDIGTHCLVPNECGFKDHCWKESGVPELSVFNLPKIKDKKWEFYSSGIIKLDDDRLTGLDPLQQRVVDVFKSGERFIDFSGVSSAIKNWKFPLVFLDFETIGPAIPRYNGTRPYQQVPFQFSVHRWDTPTSQLKHFEYLHETADDPRPALIDALLSTCGTEGSIVAYYEKFESSRIREMAETFPGKAEALLALLARIVDPLPVIRDHVYDNAFHGSFSLKAVAPAILGDSQSYDGMDIPNGTAAQRAFEELVNSNSTSERKAELRSAMLEYCHKDTLVMVDLVKWLFSLAEEKIS